MDPVTMAIVSSIAAKAPVASASTVPGVADAWEKFKILLLRKASRLQDSVQDLEESPDDEGCRLIVQGEVMRAKLNKDEEVLAAAKALLDLLNAAGSFVHGSVAPSPSSATESASSGSVVVQGNGNAAASHGGVAVGGDLHVYQSPPPPDASLALHPYLRWLSGHLSAVSMRGIDSGSGDSSRKPLDLAGVYIGLDTRAEVLEEAAADDGSVEQRKRPLRALEAAALQKRLVLLGDPGSGKSTFVRHLALCLARRQLDPASGMAERLADWPEAMLGLLPVLVVLRDLAAWLPEWSEKQGLALHAFVRSRLQAQSLDAAWPSVEACMDSGQALLLLDGLDEVPGDRREAVLAAVSAFVGRHADCRFVATCRVRTYERREWQLNDGFDPVVLAPFTKKQIRRFVQAWHEELLASKALASPEEAQNLIAGLLEAVCRPQLAELASSPLLLTVMAVVHFHRGQLPGARALLYEECVEILLERWDQAKTSVQGSRAALCRLLDRAGRHRSDLSRLLRRLAFEVHGTAAEGTADVDAWTLQKELTQLHPQKDPSWAVQVVEAIRDRAGLLVERDEDVLSFPHRTFQEYLAGAHLAGLGNFSNEALALSDDPNWRQAILLAVGHLTFCSQQRDPVLRLLDLLCPAQAEDEPNAWRRAWLAGEAVLEMGRQRLLDVDGKLDQRIRSRLADLLRLGRLEVGERVAAGNVLAQLGDPRFREDLWHLPDDDLLGFVEIPAGEFFMGDDMDERARPRHLVHLERCFVGRLPVTVAQFRAFVEASGHRPFDSAVLEGVANHPAAFVSWRDAQAYCQWLDGQLRSSPAVPRPLAELLSQGWQAGLPSEAQWEKAARGCDGRTWPWGEEEPNGCRANCESAGIGATSPVGCLPGGASPLGLLDCAGNVWEWTRSLWGKKFDRPDFRQPYDPADGREDEEAGDDVWRVMRGGSYFNDGKVLACFYRNRYYPGSRFGNGGFRLGLSVQRPSGL